VSAEPHRGQVDGFLFGTTGLRTAAFAFGGEYVLILGSTDAGDDGAKAGVAEFDIFSSWAQSLG